MHSCRCIFYCVIPYFIFVIRNCAKFKLDLNSKLVCNWKGFEKLKEFFYSQTGYGPKPGITIEASPDGSPIILPRSPATQRAQPHPRPSVAKPRPTGHIFLTGLRSTCPIR
jgi:hypothetical protein